MHVVGVQEEQKRFVPPRFEPGDRLRADAVEPATRAVEERKTLVEAETLRHESAVGERGGRETLFCQQLGHRVDAGTQPVGARPHAMAGDVQSGEERALGGWSVRGLGEGPVEDHGARRQGVDGRARAAAVAVAAEMVRTQGVDVEQDDAAGRGRLRTAATGGEQGGGEAYPAKAPDDSAAAGGKRKPSSPLFRAICPEVGSSRDHVLSGS